MGAGIFGFEADLQYTPEFFEPNDDDIDLIDSSNALTFMGNAIIGIPISLILVIPGLVLFAVTAAVWIRSARQDMDELPLDHSAGH